MRFKSAVVTILLAVSALAWQAAERSTPEPTPQLGKAPVSEVVAAMTLEEKASVLVGEGMILGPPPGSEGSETADESGSQVQPGPTVGESLTIVPGAAGATAAVARLGIPSTVLADGPAGVRISPTRAGDDNTYHATAFPIESLLASSWDTELVFRVGQAMGNEALEYGVDVLLAPALNIHRNPLGGRNFEYYSEDPLVSGKMAAAMVRGVQSQGVGTSIKHFAANNQETNRNTIDVRLTRRALREIYLKGFGIAVRESNPWTVMSSYNKINGRYASESADLLTSVLRSDWGFDGCVMTDWFGGKDPVAQMRAGNDLLMPGKPEQRKAIVEAVRQGVLEESVLDRNLERILRVVQETPRFKNYRYSNRPDLKAHAAVAREAAAQGMVLLKNDDRALPLTKAATVALFGNASYDTHIGGSGSGDVNEAYSISIHDGLRAAGFEVLPEQQRLYRDYLKEAKAKRPKPAFWFLPEAPIVELAPPPAEIGRAAESADVALLTLGRTSGEFGDRKVEADFNLDETERTLIRDVSREFEARGKKTIVLLNVGGVVETASWKDSADAVLLVWQPGQEAGHAVADVLSGKVNPSGRLTSTFPVAYRDTPSSGNFPGLEFETDEGSDAGGGLMALFQGKPSQVTYEEDVFVGYRYYSTFDVPASFDFGFGLSYTTFEQNGHRLNLEGAAGTLSLEVHNAGQAAGREVVQVYVGSPNRAAPAKQLVAFAKTRLLQPGESQRVELRIDPGHYASFETDSSSWVLEAGRYPVFVGASSTDIRWTGAIEVSERTVVGKVHDALAPEQEIQTLPAPKAAVR